MSSLTPEIEERIARLEQQLQELIGRRAPRYLSTSFVSDEAPEADEVLQWDDDYKKWRPEAVSTMKAPNVITPASLFSIGVDMAAHALAAPASTTFPTANAAIYIPFWLPEARTVTQVFWHNGATSNGQVDVGIYDNDGTRKVSAGSTTQTPINVIQSVDVTDTALAAGRYYLAVAMDDATGTLFCWTSTVQLSKSFGLAWQLAAFPLPATATFSTITQTQLPLVGLTTRSIV